jgi:hypothetical protein
MSLLSLETRIREHEHIVSSDTVELFFWETSTIIENVQDLSTLIERANTFFPGGIIPIKMNIDWEGSNLPERLKLFLQKESQRGSRTQIAVSGSSITIENYRDNPSKDSATLMNHATITVDIPNRSVRVELVNDSGNALHPVSAYMAELLNHDLITGEPHEVMQKNLDVALSIVNFAIQQV